MDEKSRLNLKKLISEYKPEETTDKIRSLKHSKMIRQEVMSYMSIKQKYSRLSKEQLYTMYQNKCNFLYNNYTNIFNKLVKNELNLQILNKFLIILSYIEEGKIDQHEGSVQVGNILKELYIDSAIKKDQKMNKYKKVEKKRKAKKVSWNEYKKTL
jgi:hypothetical protein